MHLCENAPTHFYTQGIQKVQLTWATRVDSYVNCWVSTRNAKHKVWIYRSETDRPREHTDIVRRAHLHDLKNPRFIVNKGTVKL